MRKTKILPDWLLIYCIEEDVLVLPGEKPLCGLSDQPL